MREHHLDLPIGLRAPVAGLGGERAHLLAVVVEQPTARRVDEERPAVGGERHLLAEAEVLDRGVLAQAHTGPSTDQPGQRDEFLGQLRDAHGRA